MKFLAISVVGALVAAGACNRADTAAAPPSAAAAAVTAPANAPAAKAASWTQVTIPAGTQLPILLETTVASNTSRVEEPVQARLARPVLVHGVTALPEGSRVSGIVTAAQESGRVKGRAHVAIKFDSIVPRGEDERYAMHAAAVGRTAEATKKKDALDIGAPAAGGALIGALVGGKKGALIGTGIGGGAGTAYVLSTRGHEVGLAKGAPITLKLVEPLIVKIRS